MQVTADRVHLASGRTEHRSSRGSGERRQSGPLPQGRGRAEGLAEPSSSRCKTAVRDAFAGAGRWRSRAAHVERDVQVRMALAVAEPSSSVRRCGGAGTGGGQDLRLPRAGCC
jgi:hypothetical protein